jgi:hypothetical protein
MLGLRNPSLRSGVTRDPCRGRGLFAARQSASHFAALVSRNQRLQILLRSKSSGSKDAPPSHAPHGSSAPRIEERFRQFALQPALPQQLQLTVLSSCVLLASCLSAEAADWVQGPGAGATIDIWDLLLHQPIITLSLSLLTIYTVPKIVQVRAFKLPSRAAHLPQGVDAHAALATTQGVFRQVLVPLMVGVAIGVCVSNPQEAYALGRSVYEFVQHSPVQASVAILAISALALTPYILLVAAVAAALYASATVLPINPPLPAPSAQQLLVDPARKLLGGPFGAVDAVGRVNEAVNKLGRGAGKGEVVMVESSLVQVQPQRIAAAQRCARGRELRRACGGGVGQCCGGTWGNLCIP